MTANVFSALCSVALIPPMSKGIATYVILDCQLVRFILLSLRVNLFAPATQLRKASHSKMFLVLLSIPKE